MRFSASTGREFPGRNSHEPRLATPQSLQIRFTTLSGRSESNRTPAPTATVAIRRAEGLFITDVDGRTFMDCLCGAGALALGHNHPASVEAGPPMQTLDLTAHTADLRRSADGLGTDRRPPQPDHTSDNQSCGVVQAST